MRKRVPTGGRQSWGWEEKRMSPGWAKAPSTLWEARQIFPRGAGMQWGEGGNVPPPPSRPTVISTSAPQAMAQRWPGVEVHSDPQASPRMFGELKGCQNRDP